MAVDRAALRAFFCGGPTGYSDTVYARVEGYRQALLAECRERKVACHLTGTTNAPTHLPVDSALSDVAAQCSERWPDTTRADGRSWSLPDSLEQIALACRALDDADKAGAGGEAAPTPAPPSSSSWRPLPVLTAKAATSERSSFQSSVPSWTADGMVVSLLAKGDRDGTPNPTKGGATQRCEVHLAGWENLTGTLFLRYDFTLAKGFPTGSSDWCALAQMKNSATGNPPLELMVHKGSLVLQWHDKGGAETGREVFGPATTGVKHSVVVQVPFTTSSSATVTGWFNGRQVFAASHGPTLYSGQSSFGKLGCYRSNAIGVPATVTHHGVAKGPTLASVT